MLSSFLVVINLLHRQLFLKVELDLILLNYLLYLLVKNSLTFSFEKYKSETVQKQTFVIGYIRDGIMYEGESMRNIVGSYTLTIKEDGEYNLYIISSTSDYLTIKQGIINHERKKDD